MARADGNLQNVNHIIVLMQENHSFDNYFGALAYVPGTPYWERSSRGRAGNNVSWTNYFSDLPFSRIFQPEDCATYNQLGFRVPFIVVSPFAKPNYVSHTVGDHTSILALIEKRFLNNQHMTARDANANTLEDMFDFDNSASLNAVVPAAPLPAPNDPGCPFT